MNTKQRVLSDNDRKEIKYSLRIGYIIPGSVLLIWGGIINTFLIISFEIITINHLLMMNALVILLCAFLSYIMNRKHNKDLMIDLKEIKLLRVDAKEDKTSHEAGGGNLYIPILGALFPVFWGQKPKLNYLTYLIINRFRYRVSKELFDTVKVGDMVELHYTIHGNSLLRIEKPDNYN